MKFGRAKILGLTLLFSLLSSFAIAQIVPLQDDFAPGTEGANFWTNKNDGELPRVDAQNRFQVTITKWVIVNQNLIQSHDKASDGTLFPHNHHKDDYAGGEVAEGDRFWDWMYGASDNPAKTTRNSSCTDK